jgi:hypothetical protein
MTPPSTGAAVPQPPDLVSRVLASAIDLGRSAIVPLGRLARTLRHAGGLGHRVAEARCVRGGLSGAPRLQRPPRRSRDRRRWRPPRGKLPLP